MNNESHVEMDNEPENVNQKLINSANIENLTLKEDEEHITLAGQMEFILYIYMLLMISVQIH